MTAALAVDDGGAWAEWATQVLSADQPERSGVEVFEWPDTFSSGSHIFLLDESRHPTGSLKHHTMRLALRNLVSDGTLRFGRPVIVASAGNAAIAAAYWCRVLGLSCTVVVPTSTPAAKSALIQAEHATIVPHAPPAAIYDEAQRIAETTGGFYLDYFTHAPAAASAPDWPLVDNLLAAVNTATEARPTVIVAGLGSGATAAGLHVYRRRNRLDYKITGVDAENSAYLPGWLYGVKGYGTGMPTRVEGIGRPVLPESFDPDSLDLIVQAPDAASIAGARQLRTLLNKPIGASSGANLWAALRHARRASGPKNIVTFLADAHPHYLDTCHNDAWCERKKLDFHEFADYFGTNT